MHSLLPRKNNNFSLGLFHHCPLFCFLCALRHSSQSIFLLASTLGMGRLQKEVLSWALSLCRHPTRMKTWLSAFHKAKSYKLRWNPPLWDDTSMGTEPSQLRIAREQSKACSGRCWRGASCPHQAPAEHRHSCVSKAFLQIPIKHLY